MANEFVVKNGLITPTVQLPGATSGTVTLSAPAVAGTTTIALPATAGTIVTTGDTGTVTNTMLAGSIANDKLVNNTISGTALGGTLPTATFNVSGTGLSGSATYNGTTASTFTVSSNATSANTVSTIVARDASGNFSAGTITASLNGNASTASTLQTARTITLSGDVAGSVSFNGSTDVSITATIQPDSVALGTDTTGNYVATVAVSGTGLSVSGSGVENAAVTVTSNATSANTASTIVARDASGNFTAGTITAALTSFSPTNDPASATTKFGRDSSQYIVIHGGSSGNLISSLSSSSNPKSLIIRANQGGTNHYFTFASDTGTLTAAGFVGPLTGNASTASALQTARTISLTGDVTGSVSFDGSGNAAIATTIQPDSVALGADTTGNYMVNVTAGTGVSVSHTQGEGSTATVSIGQAVGTTDNVTFNNVTVNGTLNSDDITSTNISVSGNATITGNLTVSGTTTTVNSTTISIADANIELARNATTAAEANGAGLTVTGPTTAATLTYTSADDRWNFNKNLNVGTVFGALSGNASTATTLQTARTINGVSFDGSANISFNTSSVGEGTNLYYTDTRARAALSFTAGSGAYNSSTGVITIPTNTNQLTNGAGFITGYTETDTLASVTGRGASTSTVSSFNGGGGDGLPALRINQTSAGASANWLGSFINSGLNAAAGKWGLLLLGQAESSKNSGYLGFQWQGNSSNSNAVTLGLYAADNLLRVYGGGYTEMSGSSRAPIFYDSDNTAYYADPASTSNLNAITASSVSVTAGEGREVQTYMPSSYTTNDLVSGHEYGWYSDHWRLGMTRSAATPGADFVLQWNGSRRLSVTPDGELVNSGGTTMSGGWRRNLLLQSVFPVIVFNSNSTETGGIGYDYSVTDSFVFWVNGSSNDISGTGTVAMTLNTAPYVTARGSMRAPIFYDSNDTDYLLDLNSTSSSALRIRGGTLHGPNTTWGQYLYVGTNGNVDVNTATVAVTNGNLHLDAKNGYVIYLNNYSTSSYTVANQSIRAPIFYDLDDTDYYVNPNSTSNLVAITTGATGTYNTFNTWTNLPGHHGFYSSVHNSAHFYPNNGSYGQWKMSGSRGGWSGIEFAASNGDVTMMINPDSNTSGFHNNSYGWQMRWNNGTGYIHKNAYGGGTAATIWDSSNLTNINQLTNGPGYITSVSFDGLTSKTGGTGTYQTSGDFRAPIFYDSNDTNFWVNPADGGYYLRGGSGNRVTYYTDDSGLQVANAEGTGHTIRIGAAWTRSGIYNNSYLDLGAESNINFRIANSEKGTMDSSANLFAYGSMRAPIFYNYSDTNYYLNPDDSSVLYYVDLQRANGGSDANGLVALKIAGYQNYASLELGVQSNYQAQIRTYGNDIHYYSGHWRTAGSTASEDHSHYWYTSKNGSTNWSTYKMRLDHDANLIATGSMRSPTFYHETDTNYYFSPKGSTGIRTVGDWRSDSGAWTGEFSGKIQYHSNAWYFQSAGAWYFRNAGGTNIAYIDNSGSITGNYILGTYFNASSGNSENPTIGQIWTQSTSDNYLRKSTPAHFISQLGLLTGNQTITLSGDTTGSGATSISTTTNYMTSSDDRTKAPSDDSAFKMRFGFTSWNNNNTSPYADYLHMRSYHDSSGGGDNLVSFLKSGLGMRIWQQSFGSSTAYSVYRDVALITVSDTAPTGYDTNLWWESDTGKLKIYYNDGSTSQWVDAFPIPDLTTYYSKAGGTITGPVVANSSFTAIGRIYADNGITLAQNTVADSTSVSPGILMTNSDIRSGRTSTWTGNPGTQGKIQYHSARWYIVSDSASDRIVQFRRDGSDVAHIANDGYVVAPGLTDSNDTAYYLDPASTSTSLNVRGGIVSGLSGASGGGGSLLLNGLTGSLECIPSTGSTAAEIRSGASNGIIFKANSSSVAQISSSGIISSSNITAYGSPSDRKLKENIEPLTNSLQKVMALEGVSFNWKKDTKEHTMVGLNKDIGLIAQNVQQVLPDLVREEEDGTLSLRDRGLVAVLIEAIKEQQKQIDELKAEVKALRG